MEVELERLDVVVEAEGGHGEEDVLPVDRLPLLRLTPENEMQTLDYIAISKDPTLFLPVRCLAGDEGDKLGDALLHALPRVLGYLALKYKGRDW